MYLPVHPLVDPNDIVSQLPAPLGSVFTVVFRFKFWVNFLFHLTSNSCSTILLSVQTFLCPYNIALRLFCAGCQQRSNCYMSQGPGVLS